MHTLGWGQWLRQVMRGFGQSLGWVDGQTFEAGLAMVPAFSKDIVVNWNRQEANNIDAKCSNIQEVASANSCL